MAKFILAALVCASLAACGGGGAADTPAAPARATSLFVIGNSLTFVPDQAGWSPGRGMAATDPAHDYVHLTATALGLPISAQRNFASAERPSNDPINTIDQQTPMARQIASQTAGIDAGAVVVIELGDNAHSAPSSGFDEFKANYGTLLDAVEAAHPIKLVCVSTWWQDPTKDAMIASTCAAHGGSYAPIGDIYPIRKDVAAPGEDPRIWDHPHDPSMALIAERVVAAVKS